MIEDAIKALKNGDMVLLHDASGREDEVDMVVHASAVKPETIRRMRKDGGGLICLALSKEKGESLDLPYMTELMIKSNDTVRNMIPVKTAYGDKPAFSLSVNHRDTYTGITDRDRALTITELERADSPDELAGNFYAPGHVHLLIARSIEERRGHTELSTELARRAGMTGAVVLCEMMADDGNAMSVEEAGRYAEDNGIILADGGML
ncbi:MAG: 3,4-dihydroxy-2-butanone-4-phosphate synthase [Candidatus Altiarchaeales archaeon]|nr:3,4-dihydroxy-2-butanone-4-phosphate synthase [Candidatus Altiarchaeales archaeon]MBD3417051.1 3,4-dihydroxy-2-butanone-4-phosphate synthase [Candidatus Altiarchaeales archaeon]